MRDEALGFWAAALFEFEGRRTLPPGVTVRHCPRACPDTDLPDALRERLAVFPAPGALTADGDRAFLRIGP